MKAFDFQGEENELAQKRACKKPEFSKKGIPLTDLRCCFAASLGIEIKRAFLRPIYALNHISLVYITLALSIYRKICPLCPKFFCFLGRVAEFSSIWTISYHSGLNMRENQENYGFFRHWSKKYCICPTSQAAACRLVWRELLKAHARGQNHAQRVCARNFKGLYEAYAGPTPEQASLRHSKSYIRRRK